MKRIKPAIDSIYHVYNRGVEKRNIFLDDKDKKRFLYNLFVFNNSTPAFNHGRLIEVGLQSMGKEVDEREKLVEIWAFVLMPNHFHLILKQLTENGITEFMRKLGTGYTNYFNIRYERVGPLLQGKYKAALVDNPRHYIYLPIYLHTNPLDLNNSKNNTDKAIDFLNKYKWSSHLDYSGISNFPYLVDNALLNELYRDNEQYKKDLAEWLKNKKNDEILSDVILD